MCKHSPLCCLNEFLLEAVGKVVLVEHGVVFAELGCEHRLRFPEGVDHYYLIFVDIASAQSSDDSIAVGATHHIDDIDLVAGADKLTELLVEFLLPGTEFHHAGCDKDAVSVVELSQHFHGHPGAGGVGVEGIVDDGDAAGGA